MYCGVGGSCSAAFTHQIRHPQRVFKLKPVPASKAARQTAQIFQHQDLRHARVPKPWISKHGFAYMGDSVVLLQEPKHHPETTTDPVLLCAAAFCCPGGTTLSFTHDERKRKRALEALEAGVGFTFDEPDATCPRLDEQPTAAAGGEDEHTSPPSPGPPPAPPGVPTHPPASVSPGATPAPVVGAEQAPTEAQADSKPAEVDPDDPSLPENDPTLSKTARKKLLKRRMKAENAKERKLEAKKAKHEQMAKRREEDDAKFAAMTEEERTAHLERRKALVAERREAQQARKDRQKQAFESGRPLILDLEYGELMNEREHKSLMNQLSYCVGSNTHAAKPARLVLTGISGDTKARFEALSGSANWLVDVQEKPYIEVYADKKDELVMLTADSPNEITTLDPSKTYIIGAIVDHNRYKNLTLEKAEKQGIAHARLPIGGELKMRMSKVLTVNQMVEVILNFQSSNDWIDALTKAIPKRKRMGEDDDDDDSDKEVAEPGPREKVAKNEEVCAETTEAANV